MWTAISNIFGGGAVKKGIEYLDSLHTSDTEEIKAQNEAKVNLIGALSPHNATMRAIAFMFCGAFILSFLLVLGAVMAAWWNGELVKHLNDGSLELPLLMAITSLMSSFKIHWAVMTIVSFFFAGGAYSWGQDKKREREVAREREHVKSKAGRPGE
jgi:hypothetical protein